MYEVVYEDKRFWIQKDGKILRDFSFYDPISPKIFIEEIEKNGEI